MNRTDETFLLQLITLPKIRASTNETHRNWVRFFWCWDAENCLLSPSVSQPVNMLLLYRTSAASQCSGLDIAS